MDNDLLRLIESTGLRDKEGKVYLALLELSRGNVTQISKKTGLKRSIIYVILGSLMERGLVIEVPNLKVNQYQPVDPVILLTQQKIVVKNLSEMLPLLQTLHNKGKQRPKIEYVETKEGILRIYERFNYAKEAYFVSSYVKLHEHFPREIEKWAKEYGEGKYKIEAKHLIPNDSEEIAFGKQYAASGQEVRVMPARKKFDTDIVLTDNKLSISSLEEEPFLVLIESEKLVNSLRPLFEIIWEASQELK